MTMFKGYKEIQGRFNLFTYSALNHSLHDQNNNRRITEKLLTHQDKSLKERWCTYSIQAKKAMFIVV